jgi:excisionase family DNA binding protein
VCVGPQPRVPVVSTVDPLSLDEPLLDVARAAELLNVRVSWIREATRTGYLPCLKVGKHVRYTRSMLEAWLKDQRADGSHRRSA